ncbi:MAG TPA: TonB-dependent receptor plug domain-containing protein, partial [Flavisolibacter sp.]|nr:TonB-dependent receptor plug domain-containing protein [Flavisolibacter sp.]
MHTKHYKLTVLFVLFFSFLATAQQAEVKIRVVNPKNEPVPFATLQLIPVADSTQSQQKVSDSSGTVTFMANQGAQYIVRFSSVNYLPAEKGITVKGASALFTLTAEPENKKLNAIVVTASKPVMRQEDDKTIVDPENLAATSTNAYEIMEKTPGLFVDQDGNIYLSSTTPAVVYINGREQKMSAADIATMLKNLPPTAIASIEILRTPSARYDASGSGGIVNVVLKKGVRIGLTGSLTGGLNQGRYGNQFVGFNLNNNNGSLTTYFNLLYGRRNTYDELKTDRIYSLDSLLSQDAFTRYSANSYYLGYGLSYAINKKWEVSYDGRFSYNNQNNRSANLSQLSKTGSSQTAYSNFTAVQNNNSNYNITQGVNLKYKMDSLGSEWTTDAFFTHSPNHTNQSFTNGDGELDNKLHFFSGQTNLLKKLSGKITVEAGLKTTHVWFKNSTGYNHVNGGSRIKDTIRTGSYSYN